MTETIGNIQNLREMVRSGLNFADILKVIRAKDLDMFALHVLLREAFSVPLSISRKIEDWEGFIGEGGKSDSEINKLMQPWLKY